ncbi:MAG: hypothetical protein U0989_09500 [Azonexus sp.]|nr:hypothetical protein [Azonexus sp.]MDZ4314986.1 hypothetical protein [Azonexus sp.]
MNAPLNSAPLCIPDLPTGMDYLSTLTLANPLVAEQQLMRFIDALLVAPPEPGEMLSLLEHARVPICFVEEEMAQLYHNKPLVLTTKEEESFQQVVTAWRKMLKAYALCVRLEQPEANNPQHASLMASILHRCIYYTGMIILEHYRARRELPRGIWLELHGFYETAEEWGLAYTPVEDSLENSFQATHCAAAYATLLLIDIASPYSNSVRNLNLIRRWATMWAPLISIHQLDDDLEIPPYIVELFKDTPLQPSALIDKPDSYARRLDTTRLGLQINHMLSQLRQRISPSQLGLGEETAGHVIQLLERLSRPWTQAASPRKFRRFSSEGIARLAVGFEAMHFLVSGKAFEQPTTANTYSRSECDQLFTFGDRANPGQSLNIHPEAIYPVEDWAVINHSANGFRLAQSNPGLKIRHGQLIVICPHDGEHFLLAQATWLMEEVSTGLLLGVSTLPGLPIGIGIRIAAENNTASERLTRAFLLPPMPIFNETGSIVLPTGVYHPSRILDVFTADGHWQLRLDHIIQRGADFDRIDYQAL